MHEHIFANLMEGFVPQLQFIDGRRHPFRTAETDLHGPDRSADHRDSPVAVRFQVVDTLVVQVVLAMPVFVNDRCAGSDSSESRGGAADAVLRCCGHPCDHAATFGLANSGGASDSVHRGSWSTFQFATEMGTLLH